MHADPGPMAAEPRPPPLEPPHERPHPPPPPPPAPPPAPIASAPSPAFAAALEAHPHARLVLGAALADKPSHAYLFHGPAGTGKAAGARAFAAELLAVGEADPDAARTRVMHGSHPDLTW